MKKHIKNENGSITLFVLVSMLFMTMLLATIFTLSTNNEIARRNVTTKLKETYEAGVDKIDEIYLELSQAKAYDQCGNEIENFLDNWEYSSYAKGNTFVGWRIQYKGEIINGEVPYFIRMGKDSATNKSANEKYVVSYEKLFEKTKNISDVTSINLSKFNTENIINYDKMFAGYSNLTGIYGLRTTDKAERMLEMFNVCEKLIDLDLSGFDTTNVYAANSMFMNCKSLEYLDLTKFNTSKLTNFSYMFYNCQKLTEIDVSGFNTEIVTNMEYMFYYCKVTTLNLGESFVMTKVSNIENMFVSWKTTQSVYVANSTTKQTLIENASTIRS